MKPLSRRVGQVAVLALLGALALTGQLGDAAPLTLKTIRIDGAISDWSQVHTNAAQTTKDGDGRTIVPCSLSTDRDCPVGGGTGNDLLTFSWTYDPSFVYLFIERYQAATTGVDFFFAADVNFDGRFDSGGTSNDKLIHVNWSGSSNSVAMELCPYTPQPKVAWSGSTARTVGTRVQPIVSNGFWYVAIQAGTSAATQPAWCTTAGCEVNDGSVRWRLDGPAGTDPMAHPVTGLVDGYTLPGSSSSSGCTNLSSGGSGSVPVGTDASWCTSGGTPVSCGFGAPGGLSMEARVRWDAFGPGTTAKQFYWHVSSSNNSHIEQTVDNIGAPNGELGSFFFYSASLTPDGFGAVFSPGVVSYDHVLLNDGNSVDVLDLRATSTQGARLDLLDGATVFATDLTGDGAWETVLSGYDSTGDGRPDFSLAAGASRAFTVRVTMPSSRTGRDVTRVTAFSTNDADVSATAADTSFIGGATLSPFTQTLGTVAGVPATFAGGAPITLTNFQTSADVFDFTATHGGTCNWRVDLFADNAGVVGAAMATDLTGDGVWDSVTANTNGNGSPDLGTIGANRATQKVWLRVSPPAGTTDDTECETTLRVDSPTSGAFGQSVYTLIVGQPVTYRPNHTVALGTNKLLTTGGTVFFAGVIQNNEAVARSYTLSATQSASPARPGLLPPVFWTDPDGDGNPSDGCVIGAGGCMTSTPVIGPFGGQFPVAVQMFGSDSSGPIPVTDPHIVLTLNATATATAGGASGTQVDQATIGYVATYADALFTQNARFFAPCQTVYIRAEALVPSNVTNYALTVRDGSGAVVRTVSPWPTTARGTAEDSFTLTGAATGTWTVQLTDSGSAVPPRVDSLTFTIERTAAFTQLITDKINYAVGDALSINATVRNNNVLAPLSGTLRYVVENQAGTQVANLSGTFSAAPGTTRTVTGISANRGRTASDGFTLASVNYPAIGAYRVYAEWQLACAATPIITSSTAAFMVPPTAPAITGPAPGTTFVSGALTVSGTGSPGAQVNVTVGSATFGPATVTGGGAWSVPVTGLAAGAHSATATQTVSGATSAPSAPRAFQVDTTPPVIASPATGLLTRQNSLTLTGASGGNAGAVTAELFDGAVSLGTVAFSGGNFSFTETNPPRLAEGTRNYQVRSRDSAGGATGFSNTVTVTVDRTPPVTAITSAPPDPDSSVNPTFTFSSSPPEVGLTFQCKLDAAPGFTDCQSPETFTGLGNGSHRLEVLATDEAGNTDATAEVHQWDIDTSLPDTTIDVGPPAITNQASATFQFSSTASPATFQCRLDSAPTFTACTASPTFGPLADGAHVLRVRSRNSALTFDPDPAVHSWEIDTLAPQAPVISPVAANTTSPTISGTAEPGATVRLFIDGLPAGSTTADGTTGAWSLAVTGLSEAAHDATAEAEDAATNVGPVGSRTFTTDVTAPDTSFALTPLVITRIADASFAFSSTEAGVTYECSLEGVAFSTCDDTLAFTATEGTHSLEVRSRDVAGNVDGSAARFDWRVDLTLPDTIIASGPPERAIVREATFQLTSTEVVTYECALDGAAFSPCPTPVQYADLSEGNHVLQVRAVDEAGNVDATPGEHAWEVLPELKFRGTGCGCGATESGAPAAFGLLALAAVLTRRRQLAPARRRR